MGLDGPVNKKKQNHGRISRSWSFVIYVKLIANVMLLLVLLRGLVIHLCLPAGGNFIYLLLHSALIMGPQRLN